MGRNPPRVGLKLGALVTDEVVRKRMESHRMVVGVGVEVVIGQGDDDDQGFHGLSLFVFRLLIWFR